VSCGSRIIARNDLFTAFVPFASRWPVEVHIYPNRFVRNLSDLDDGEVDGFAQMCLDILGRFDALYPTQLPYISALHRYTDTDAQREGYFHVELISTRRSATELSTWPDRSLPPRHPVAALNCQTTQASPKPMCFTAP
jgi:UDPglucose--hexose-1-phosphate uridylyltransferase